jgi:hypothetical protein
MNCSFCNTLNIPQANFCFHCGKAMKIDSFEKFSIEVPEEISRIRSWGYILAKPFPMPYWITIILFWQIMLAGNYFISNYYGVDPLMLFNFFLLSSYACSAIIVEFSNREMQRFYPRLLTFVTEPQDKIKTWYTKSLYSAFMGRGALACGLVFAVVGGISIYDMVKQLSSGMPEITWYREITSVLGFFFVGTGMWTIFSIIRITSQLSGFKINAKLLAMGNGSVMALGNLLLRISLAITFVYCLVLIADILAGIITSYIIIAWNGIAVLTILMFFVIPQYKIHKIMAREKQQRLQSFTVYLENSMNESLNNPSVEKMQNLKALFELKKHLSDMHEWTFSSGTISQLISVLIIPLLLLFLELYLGK